MPIDYANYPATWLGEIRPRILAREGNCCKFCGIANGLLGWRVPSGRFITAQDWATQHIAAADEQAFARVLKRKPTPYRIVLTVAHLDHQLVDHGDANLAALCQRCHLNYDRRAVALRRRQARRYSKHKRQLLLFPLPEQPTLLAT
ncbi:MAG: hypothetical protein ACRYFK_07575 [Janthinobacterium lividum]